MELWIPSAIGILLVFATVCPAKMMLTDWTTPCLTARCSVSAPCV
jgi:hypothetical protein